MSAAKHTTTRTIRTWCPIDGEVVARMNEDAGESAEFHCSNCGLTIPRQIIELGPDGRGDIDG